MASLVTSRAGRYYVCAVAFVRVWLFIAFAGCAWCVTRLVGLHDAVFVCSCACWHGGRVLARVSLTDWASILQIPCKHMQDKDCFYGMHRRYLDQTSRCLSCPVIGRLFD